MYNWPTLLTGSSTWFEFGANLMFHSLWQAGLVYFIWRLLRRSQLKGKTVVSSLGLYASPIIFIGLMILTIGWMFPSPGVVSSSMPTESTIMEGDLVQVFYILLCMVWLMGFMWHGLRIILSFNALQKIRKEAIPAKGHFIYNLFEEMKSGMNFKKTVKLRFTNALESPLVTGFFQPIIFFPVCLANNLTQDEVRVILAHELSHVENYDYLFNLLLSFLEAAFFFNPFVLNLIAEIKLEREVRCDQLAVETVGSKMKVAQALVNLQEYRLNKSLGLGVMGEGQFGTRINRIIGNDQNLNRTKTIKKIILGVLLLPTLFAFDEVTESSLFNQPNENFVMTADSLFLPGVKSEIHSIEFFTVNGEIKDLKVNDEKPVRPTKDQELELQKFKAKTNTNSNRFEEYENFLKKEIHAGKDRIKELKMQKSTPKESKDHPYTMVENNDPDLNVKSQYKYEEIYAEYAFGKSFQKPENPEWKNLYYFDDGDVFVWESKNDLSIVQDEVGNFFVSIPGLVEGNEQVLDAVFHMDSITDKVKLAFTLQGSSQIEDVIEEKLNNWLLINPEQNAKVLLTNDILVINGELMEDYYQDKLSRFYLEFTGKDPHAVFNFQIKTN